MAEKPGKPKGISAHRKTWGSRFSQPTAEAVAEFTASIGFDWRLYPQDIAGSRAHVRMLAKQGIVSSADAEAIERGLAKIRAEFEGGEIELDPRLEDIHTHVEARLRQKIGEAAGRLHTARSRNDQVATDVRMWCKEAVTSMARAALVLQGALLEQAAANQGTIMPGYTHMQRAQPVLFAHHLLAYVEMLFRDLQRLDGCYTRCDVLPLGSGALAGVTYPIDREFVARELGFAAISENSMDAVSDRDFAIEVVAALSILMMHLSRLAAEIVTWTTAEFGFLELDDAYAGGSSMMPQKKNPDVAELVRGKSGRVFGHLQALLTVMQGLPLTYNRDLQEDKEALFDAVDTSMACLAIVTGLVRTWHVRAERMRSVADASFSTATDLADYLARRGLPFREAHEVVGRLVARCVEQGQDLLTLTADDLHRASPLFGEDAPGMLRAEASAAARTTYGGTAPTAVAEGLARARGRWASTRQRWGTGATD